MGSRYQPLLLRGAAVRLLEVRHRVQRDRKSTRLNSSHSQISYAVFCLKKKKEDRHQAGPDRDGGAAKENRARPEDRDDDEDGRREETASHQGAAEPGSVPYDHLSSGQP